MPYGKNHAGRFRPVLTSLYHEIEEMEQINMNEFKDKEQVHVELKLEFISEDILCYFFYSHVILVDSEEGQSS